jgi:hypothetical protein
MIIIGEDQEMLIMIALRFLHSQVLGGKCRFTSIEN